MSDTANKSLLIIDPPYLHTSVYKHNLESYSSHKKLAEAIRNKCCNNSDFIYFCRITAGHETPNTSKESREKRKKKSVILKGEIENLYWGYGFYYKDVPLKNGVIERIITNIPFKDATLFGRERA